MAEKAAKSIADMQEADEDSESSAKEEEIPDTELDSDDESLKLKKLALGKLEDASEESLLSQAKFFLLLLIAQEAVVDRCDDIDNAILLFTTYIGLLFLPISFMLVSFSRVWRFSMIQLRVSLLELGWR